MTAGTQRVASLRAQRDRQLLAIQERTNGVSDSNIMRMYQSELANVKDKFDRLIAQHDSAVTGSDLVTRQIATAILEVVAP